jgi:hypothetical protein
MDAREPINLRAGRIASLAEAASVVYHGGGFCDPLQCETVGLDLMAVAARLAAELAADTEEACYDGRA